MAWTVFRLGSWEDIKTVFSRVFTMATGIQYYYVYSLVFAVLLTVYYVIMMKKKGGDSYGNRCVLDLHRFWHLFLFMMVIWFIILFGYIGNNAFIYCAF